MIAIGKIKCSKLDCKYCVFKRPEFLKICLNDKFKSNLTIEQGLELALQDKLIPQQLYNRFKNSILNIKVDIK